MFGGWFQYAFGHVNHASRVLNGDKLLAAWLHVLFGAADPLAEDVRGNRPSHYAFRLSIGELLRKAEIEAGSIDPAIQI
jgi:hypothetical protein